MIAHPRIPRRSGMRRAMILCLSALCVAPLIGLAQPFYPRPPLLFSYHRYDFARFGYYLLTLGDVNRDGVSDLFMNIVDVDSGFHTWLAFGKRPGVLDMKNHRTLDGGGMMVKGDVNDDGLLDILVRDRVVDSVSIYLGCSSCPNSIDSVVSFVLHQPKESDFSDSYYGERMAIGDLNGDGVDDIVIAAPGRMTSNQAGAGSVYVYFGGKTLRDKPDISAVYPHYRNVFGDNGLWVADVNGDGICDLIVATEAFDGVTWKGLVDVYFGGTSFAVDTEHPGQRFGEEILGTTLVDTLAMRWNLNVLDVNNDGAADLIVLDQYRAFCCYGGLGGFRSPPDRVIPIPDATWFQFYNRAHRISDINGDGLDDFLLSGVYGTPSGNWISILFIYLGSQTGIPTYPTAIAWNPDGGAGFGENVVNLGDMDGDGYNDFAVGFATDGTPAPAVAIFGGYPWEPTDVLTGPSPVALTLATYPNPFEHRTTITLANPGGEVREVVIYDAFGRPVKIIPLANQARDEIRIHWDGTNNEGSRVPAGVYYVVALSVEGRVTGRIVKLN